MRTPLFYSKRPYEKLQTDANACFNEYAKLRTQLTEAALDADKRKSALMKDFTGTKQTAKFKLDSNIITQFLPADSLKPLILHSDQSDIVNHAQRKKAMAKNKQEVLDYIAKVRKGLALLYIIRNLAVQDLQKNMPVNQTRSFSDFRTPKNGQELKQPTLKTNYFKSKGNSSSRVLN